MINFTGNNTCTVGRGFQYSIRGKLASESIHPIMMPSADRLLALSQRGISPGLRKALNQGTGDRGWAHLANHKCCTRHRNASLEVLSVSSSDLILMAFITGNSDLEPLLEGLFAQIHIDLS